MPLRQLIGALLRDSWSFERRVRGRWERIHNRHDTITIDGDRRGVRCEWQWTHPVDYCRFVPGAGVRLMRAALAEWPIGFSDAPPLAAWPDVTFLIGHRGLSRLPHLLLTLRSIAAQHEAGVECIVIEQSARPEIRDVLPSWVRYIHQPVAEGDPYRRAATFNAGASAARGRLLVLHDNDMLVPDRYAAEIVAHERKGWEVIDLKRFIFYLTKEDSGRVLSLQRLTLREQSEVVIQNLHGGSIAITAEAYAAIGGFDESFVGWGGEDVELWERAETRRATRFGYLPIIHLWHEAQPEKLLINEAPAVKRYNELTMMPVDERIERLRARDVE